MKEITRFFRGKKINSILDVGTGLGDFIGVLKNISPNADITGTDPNPESLWAAAKKYPQLEFIDMAGENLIFRDNEFDVASISMALHHLSDTCKTLSEMRRVVKLGGWIIVAELYSDNLNPAQENHKLYHHFRSKIDRINGVSHNPTFTKKEIIELVKSSGIKICFDFEVIQERNLISNCAELDGRLQKMEEMLEPLENNPEYEGLKQQIEVFRQRTVKHGFQPAPRVVIVGEN